MVAGRHAEERGGGLAGLGARGDAELEELGFEEPQAAAHGAGPAGCGMQAHDRDRV
jgi:hypothetical protein